MTKRPILGHLARAARPWRRAERVQVGAIPWRAGPDGRIEVLLITSRGTGQWIVPKGGTMAGLSPAESAAEEAWEEAGVRGVVETGEAGRFTHMKSREGGPPIRCRVIAFRLRVETVARHWPERGQRKRRWFTLDEAMAAVRSAELRVILADLGGREG